MWSPSGGLPSVSASPIAGKRQAAVELEKTKRRRPRGFASSSTLRSPWTFVRSYSGCSSPVKS